MLNLRKSCIEDFFQLLPAGSVIEIGVGAGKEA